MPELAAPLWLLALPPALAVIWWLHRLRSAGDPLPVAALFLWRESEREARTGVVLARRADRLWWLRAGIAAALILALTDPGLRSQAARLVVWWDDSPSMQAVEGERTRAAAAAEALVEALRAEHAANAGVTLRSLADPAAALSLAGSPDRWRESILAWLAARAPAVPRWPAALELDAAARHWLVTDGAVAGMQTWLDETPVTRVIQVGGGSANAAVTRLAVRAALQAPQRWQGLVDVHNAGDEPTTRTVSISADGAVLERRALALPPGGGAQVDFALPDGAERLRASLDSGDALSADDALELSVDREPVAVAIVGTCGPGLSAALHAHPRLTFGAPAARLRVVCDEHADEARVPTLWVHRGAHVTDAPQEAPAWGRAAGDLAGLFLDRRWIQPVDAEIPSGDIWLSVGARPLIVYDGATPTLHTLFDLDAETLVERPDFPALVAALVAAVQPAAALDAPLAAQRDATAVTIAPRALHANARAGGRGTDASLRSLQPIALAAALLLLIMDVALVLVRQLLRRPTPGPARALRRAPATILRALAPPLLVAAAVAVAWSRPAVLMRDWPRDLVVLWDDSGSMRAAATDDAWQRLSRLAAAAPDGSRATVVRFAGRAVVDVQRSASVLAAFGEGRRPERAAAVDADASDLPAGLEAALRSIDPGRPSAIALLTDGRVAPDPSRGLLDRARAAGVPIYALPVETKPVPLLDVRAPLAAAAGQAIPVDVTVQSPAPASGRLGLFVDGRPAGTAQLELAPGRPAGARFRLAPPAGEHELQAVWESQAGRADQTRGLMVDGARPWLLLSGGHDEDAARALRAAGWPLVVAPPAQLATYADRLGELAGIVIDDVSVDQLTATGWAQIQRAVTELGISLVALGGPHSFGAGGYRRSALESLLPVTAEGRDPRGASAIVFLVDASGSMGRSITGLNPMGYAQRAVLETARSLDADDEVGLVGFDVEARALLPLARYPDPAAALQGVYGSLGPAGGTRLRPALTQALREIEHTQQRRRLIVLVTDGFLDDEDLAPLLKALRDQGAELLALAVGGDADTIALRKLAGAENVFTVERLSKLPELMRAEVEKRRQPVHEGKTRVRTVAQVPGWTASPALPPVSGFARTRVKAGAAVYLETEGGDPLLAMQHAGAGRVAALPAGLGPWAATWTGAPTWPRLGAALGDWLAGTHAAAYFDARLDEDGSGWRIRVDAVGPDGAWDDAAELSAALVGPGGASLRFALPRLAPGRFGATVPADTEGRYLFTVADGERELRQVHWRTLAAERASAELPSAVPGWLAAGLVRAAPERNEDWRFSAGGPGPSVRPSVLAALLVGFLASLAYPHRKALAAVAVNWLAAVRRRLGRDPQTQAGQVA